MALSEVLNLQIVEPLTLEELNIQGRPTTFLSSINKGTVGRPLAGLFQFQNYGKQESGLDGGGFVHRSFIKAYHIKAIASISFKSEYIETVKFATFGLGKYDASTQGHGEICTTAFSLQNGVIAPVCIECVDTFSQGDVLVPTISVAEVSYFDFVKGSVGNNIDLEIHNFSLVATPIRL